MSNAPHTQCQPDIVERLRFAAKWSETVIDIAPPELLKQAADRIATLEAAKSEFYDRALTAEASLQEAYAGHRKQKARIEKLTKALEHIAIVCTQQMDRDCNHRMALDGVRQIANDALTLPLEGRGGAT